MNQALILYPMLTLIGLTFAVVLLAGAKRFRAVGERRVRVRDFALGESANVPDDVSLPNRNLMNLLETPVLFYVVALTFYVTQRVDMAAVTLAWVYVAFRFAHSYVHLTYNRVFHRLAMFAGAGLALIALWAWLLVRLMR